MQILQVDPSELDKLPQELRERFPEVVDQLRDGVIDEVPDRVLSQLPTDVKQAILDSPFATEVNMTFVIILAAVAILALLGFGYGMAKAAAKAALFFLVVGGIAAALLYVQF